jgi:hypothetical protein
LALLYGRGKGEAEQEGRREEALRMAGGGGENGARLGTEVRLCIAEHWIHETKRNEALTALNRFVPAKRFHTRKYSIFALITLFNTHKNLTTSH